MWRWTLVGAACWMLTGGGLALAGGEDDRPAETEHSGRPEGSDRGLPANPDGLDARHEQELLEYEDAMARCGGSWSCRRHVRHDFAERRRYDF
jgi:hypothetical protein